MTISKVTLDVNGCGSQQLLHVRLHDTKRQLCIVLTENGDSYSFDDNCTAILVAKKSDGSVLFNSCQIWRSTLFYDFTPQTAAVAGITECEVRVYDAHGKILTSPRFVIYVEDRVTTAEEEVLSDSEKTALDAMAEAEIQRENNELLRQSAEEQRRTEADEVLNAAREAVEISAQVPAAIENAQRAAENANNAAEETRESYNQALASASEAQDMALSAQQTADNATLLAENAQNKAEAAHALAEGKASPATTLAGYGIADAYTKDEIDRALAPLSAYPVGAVYISESSTSPAALFGGSWEAINNRFLFAHGNEYLAGQTGGSADAVAVRHKHEELYFTGAPENFMVWSANVQGSGGQAGLTLKKTSDGAVPTIYTTEAGEDGAGKNMPPYLSVYMWRRIA